MPVTTVSSRHPAPHHQLPDSSGNSTRDRSHDEGPRLSMGEMQELDGSALHERNDWPLSSPPSPITEEDEIIVKAAVQQEPAEIGDDNVDFETTHGSRVVRKPEDLRSSMVERTFMEEPDVSDMEDENEEDEDEEEEEEEEEGDNIPSPLQHTQRTQRQAQQVSDSHRQSRSSVFLTQPESPPEVSPIREEHAARISDIRQSVHLDHPVLGPQEQCGPLPIVSGQGSEDGNEAEESQDVVPIIPVSPESPPRQGTMNTSPRLNGNWTPSPTISSSHRSTFGKAPMPISSHRRSSTLSSFINTTKERVRYSWQSLQEGDHEPNRPRIHIIKLVSNTATASAGFPTGEALGFSVSPGGRRVAAFNSARLYVLQTNALPVGITQDYALKRRPLAVELTDEGNTMAILADDHTINIYDIGMQLKRVRTITVDFPATCIALSSTGGLVAAAYEGGVEVFSLAPSALPTDRRAVRSIKMDRLVFSEDGSTLLGTTTRVNASSTVVVSVPVFPASADNIPTHEELKEAWCTGLLHPENIRNSSHATFMRENRKSSNERLFAWNGLEDTFGMLSVSDMQYGDIDFPVVISPPLSMSGGLGAAIHSCPSLDEHGGTVAMIVNDRTIRLYVVPAGTDDDEPRSEAHSIDHELDEGYGCPFSEVRWVHSSASLPLPQSNPAQIKGRLVVTSPGGVAESNFISEESVEDIEGGRIIVFDFDPQFTGQPAQTFSLILGKSPAQLLEEEESDISDQVALVRRRTVNQSKGGGLSSRPVSLGRAAGTHSGRPLRTPSPAFSSTTASQNRASMMSIGSLQFDAARSLPDLLESNEQVDVFDQPYVQGAPRTQASLARANTNIQRHRFQTLEERQQERVPPESTSNFLALPEYTEEPNAPLPSRYRAMAGLDKPALFSPKKSAVGVNISSSTQGSSSVAPLTAPPDIGESFSADAAFEAANARAAEMRESQTQLTTSSMLARPMSPMTARPSSTQHSERTSTQFAPVEPEGSLARASPTSSTWNRDSVTSTQSHGKFNGFQPPGRTSAFESLSSLPRGLQRAYSNAVAPPFGIGSPPSLIGDWRNVSPIVGSSSSKAGSAMNGFQPGLPPDEDVITPVTSSPGRRYSQQSSNYRYSTSRLNPPGHTPPRRTLSTASSFDTIPSNGIMNAPRLPPHVQAFRSAAVESQFSASLFPPNQPTDHVPLRQNMVRASAVGHPITAWHPPAPSSNTPPRTSSSMRRHRSRKGGNGRSAFATTAKAKNLGFFKKQRKHDPYGLSRENGSADVETKSMATWMTRGNGKCGVM